MTTTKGHDPGHDDLPGCTWERYVELLVSEAGGWAPLADALIHKARGRGPSDRTTVEKGIRRLAARGQRPGGQYGRLLIESFGVPRVVEDWARWMGQHHSRFADLPVPLREAELLRWNRPPIAESAAASWIQIGLASCALRRGDALAAIGLLTRAKLRALRTGGALEAEHLLFDARLLRGEGDDASADALLVRAGRVIGSLSKAEFPAYGARLADQHAYAILHPTKGEPRIADALSVYRSIPELDDPFVAFRRAHGIAYCTWKLGKIKDARVAARAAVEHAGDAGQIRFRVLALDLLSHLVDDEEAESLRGRARRMARALSEGELHAT
ncbi:hypothetical protein BH09MYX1_BH09MYX1_29320 [soil metagenome]